MHSYCDDQLYPLFWPRFERSPLGGSRKAPITAPTKPCLYPFGHPANVVIAVSSHETIDQLSTSIVVRLVTIVLQLIDASRYFHTIGHPCTTLSNQKQMLAYISNNWYRVPILCLFVYSPFLPDLCTHHDQTRCAHAIVLEM